MKVADSKFTADSGREYHEDSTMKVALPALNFIGRRRSYYNEISQVVKKPVSTDKV